MILQLVLFVLGFVLLVKGADLLVDGASSVARRFNISNIVIGLTIVAFGTSMPELIVNVIASAQGNTDIAIGNVLGSNIANILLILGISAMIYPILAQRNTVIKEIPFSLLAAVVIGIMANDVLLKSGGSTQLGMADGLILLCFFIIFMYYTFSIVKTQDELTNGDDGALLTPARSGLYILAGLVGLVVGGKWIVDGAVLMAGWIGMSEAVVGLTVVAIGTSLPELATSAVAAMKKQSDIAIGNVVGSNIFNIFWILGVSAMIKPLPFNTKSNVDIIMTIAASALLFVLMYLGKRHTIERWQGALMVMVYVSYVAYLLLNQ